MNKKLVGILVLIIMLLCTPFVFSNSKGIQQSEIEIGDISGGFGKIKAEIKNIGEETAINIEWSINVVGGFFGRINSSTSGNIISIGADNSKIIKSKTVFGLGNIKVKVNVNGLEKTVNGFIFLNILVISSELNVNLESVANGLTSPIALSNAGDGSNRLFIADQTGQIFIAQNNKLLSEPFLNISNKIVTLNPTYDERGLLGLAFHPNYSNNGRFFVYYSTKKTDDNIDHESILSEFQVSNDPNQADPNSEKIIFRVDQPESNHNGGQLAFGPDGYLYIGLGDGGGAGDQHGIIGNGQDINTSLGSILRIDIDSTEPYAIPPDNPFVGINGLDEIYAWGFRNPWKFSFDSEKLIVADVGQDEWEEIDIVEKGINYGWRIMEGNHPYDFDLADLLGIEIETLGKPIYEYSHSVGKSITGGYFYRGNQSPKLFGKYVFGDWSTSFVRANGKLYYLEENEQGVWERYELIPSKPFNRYVLSFGEDENGEIYVLTKTTLGPSGSTGEVSRIIVN